ncbi:MAG TPA: 50S ribosomal protein L1 [Candidatus Babeliales bacterium]|nr:50S ribosomal protein L1 [Candidatus Babeliales bacterium]
MSKHGKKYSEAKEKVVPNQVVPVDQALSMAKSLAYAKFDESVDVHVNLGIDSSKGEQVVRGSVVLPNGRGRTIKVLVFAKGDQAEAAKKAGADYVGVEDLVEKINGGWLDFDYAVATPDLMGVVGQLAKVLGPRGLLPNKKLGTVALDVAPVVKELKQGRVFFKNDKSGIVHFSFGKRSFDVNKLHENLAEFVRALVASKPAASKGKFLKKMTICTTMGVGIQINPDEVLRS